MAKCNVVLALVVGMIVMSLQGCLSKKESKKCSYNGVVYKTGEESIQGTSCCRCQRSGEFECPPETMCYLPKGCAKLQDAPDHGRCCKKCDCKNAAEVSFSKNERWTNTVDGVCYECKCTNDGLTAKCKAKTCKNKCSAEDKPEARYCCVCGKPLKPTRAPPKKWKNWKDIHDHEENKKRPKGRN